MTPDELAGWHSMDEQLPDPVWKMDGPPDDFPLLVHCDRCGRELAAPVCDCGQVQGLPVRITVEPGQPTHGDLILEIARLRCSMRQAVADLEENMAAGWTGLGTSLALSGLKRALGG